MSLEYRHLEYLCAVVDASSVSAAAKSLGISQPALSAAITKLERDLGVELLERTARGIRPTSAGRYLFTNARRMVAERDRVATELARIGDGIVGELRVGLEPMVIHEVMADVVTEFVRQAPGVRLTLSDQSPDLIVRGIDAGNLDVGCVPFAEDHFADFVRDLCDWQPIAKIDVKLAIPSGRAGEDHPDGRGWGRWIVPSRLTGFSGMPDLVHRAVGAESGFETLEVSTPQTAVAFVKAGLGVAPVTANLAGGVEGIQLIDAPRWLPPMQATLVWRKGIEVTPVLQRWIDATRLIAARRLGPANVIHVI